MFLECAIMLSFQSILFKTLLYTAPEEHITKGALAMVVPTLWLMHHWCRVLNALKPVRWILA